MSPLIFPGIAPQKQKAYNLVQLIGLVAEMFTVSETSITAPSTNTGKRGKRDTHVAEARFVCMYFMFHSYGMKDSDIAAFFHMHRTSAVHGRQYIAHNIEIYKDFALKIAFIKTTLNFKAASPQASKSPKGDFRPVR